jgi:hypothetical protein
MLNRCFQLQLSHHNATVFWTGERVRAFAEPIVRHLPIDIAGQKQDSLSETLLNDNPEKSRYKAIYCTLKGILFLQTI